MAEELQSHQSPDGKPIQSCEIEYPINRLAYKIAKESAKSLRTLILEANMATKVRILRKDGATALLIHFKDWEQTAHFYESILHNPEMQPLISSLRMPCGNVRKDGLAYRAAMETLSSMAGDRKVSEADLKDSDTEPDGDKNTRISYLQMCYTEGIYCHLCEEVHRSYQQF